MLLKKGNGRLGYDQAAMGSGRLALLSLNNIVRLSLKREENHGFSIFSLAIRARRVLRSRPRISEALFLPLTFQPVCTNT